MKKKLLMMCVLATASTAPICGNKDMFDTVYTYDRAIVRLPDDTVIDGKVDSWTDYADDDQIQVTIEGKTYLVHSSNISLIAE